MWRSLRSILRTDILGRPLWACCSPGLRTRSARTGSGSWRKGSTSSTSVSRTSGIVRGGRACRGHVSRPRDEPTSLPSSEPNAPVQVIHRLPVRISILELSIPPVPSLIAHVGGAEGAMLHRDQRPFEGPHVPLTRPPVHAPNGAEVKDAVADNPARHVDVWIKVAPREVADGAEHGSPAKQAGVTGLRDGAPRSPASKEEHDVIEFVDGLHVEEQRRVTVLLHDHCCAESRFEAVGGAEPRDDAERPQGFPVLLVVVWEGPQPTLNQFRSPEPLDEGPFPAGERVGAGRERFRRRGAGHPHGR